MGCDADAGSTPIHWSMTPWSVSTGCMMLGPGASAWRWHVTLAGCQRGRVSLPSKVVVPAARGERKLSEMHATSWSTESELRSAELRWAIRPFCVRSQVQRCRCLPTLVFTHRRVLNWSWPKDWVALSLTCLVEFDRFQCFAGTKTCKTPFASLVSLWLSRCLVRFQYDLRR